MLKYLLCTAMLWLAASTAYAIEGGIPDSGEPAIGQLFYGRGMCAATLVFSDAVITAAHCVEFSEGVPAVQAHWIGAGMLYRVTHVSSAYVGGSSTDIAILFLDRPVTHVRPISVAGTYPRPTDTLRVYGYGCTSQCPLVRGETGQGCGRKHRKDISASALPEWSLATDQLQVCFGDSGGPVINMRTHEIVAVTHGFIAPAVGERRWFSRSSFANAVEWKRSKLR